MGQREACALGAGADSGRKRPKCVQAAVSSLSPLTRRHPLQRSGIRRRCRHRRPHRGHNGERRFGRLVGWRLLAPHRRAEPAGPRSDRHGCRNGRVRRRPGTPLASGEPAHHGHRALRRTGHGSLCRPYGNGWPSAGGAPGSAEIGEFWTAVTLTADFTDDTVSGGIGCRDDLPQGDFILADVITDAATGEQHPFSGFRSDFQVTLNAARINSDGTFSADNVALYSDRNDRQSALGSTLQGGSWGGCPCKHRRVFEWCGAKRSARSAHVRAGYAPKADSGRAGGRGPPVAQSRSSAVCATGSAV